MTRLRPFMAFHYGRNVGSADLCRWWSRYGVRRRRGAAKVGTRRMAKSRCLVGFSGSRLRYASGMDVLKMLAELRQERAQIGEAIMVLERLVIGHGKRRGRPPAWMIAVSAPKWRGRPPKNQSATVAPEVAAPTKKRRRLSAAQRKAQAERMKAYWAAKRKKQAKK